MASIRKNLGYSMVLSLSQVAFPLITFPYAMRTLYPEGIGIVGLAESFTQCFIVIAALGIGSYGVREVARARHNRPELDKLFSELFSIHFIASLLCAAVYIFLILFVDRLSRNQEVFFIGCGILLSSTFLIEWFFQGMENFAYITKRGLFFKTLSLVLLFVLVKSPADKTVYYGLSLFSTVCIAVSNLFYARQFVSLRLKNLDISRHLKPLFYLFSTFVITNIYTTADSIILGFLSDETHVGYYTSGIRISKVASGLLFSAAIVMVPRLSAFYKEDNVEEALVLLNKSARLMIFLSVPLAIGMAVIAPDLVVLFGNSEFFPAGASLRILSFTILIIGIAHIYAQQILIPIKKEKLVMRAVIIGAVISLASNFLLIPTFKHVGAAISNLATELIVTGLLIWYANKSVRLNFPFRELVFSIIACLPFYPIYLLLNLSDFNLLLKVLISIVTSAGLYMCIQFFGFKNVTLREEMQKHFL